VDNISGTNLALFFGGTSTDITQAAGTATVSNNYTITPDTYIMLGANPNNPTGDVAVSNPTVTLGGTTAVDTSLYNYDVNTGLLYVQPTATAETVWNIGYQLGAAQLNQVIETGVSIYGQLLFVANNPRGPQRDFFFPFIKITSEGTLPLKGDTWMTLSFAWEAMNLNAGTRRCYVRARPASLVLPNGP